MLDAGAGETVDAMDHHTVQLHHATNASDLDAIRLLVERGVSVDARCATGNTPLHNAAAKNNRQLVSTLLQLGADTNATAVLRGFTPLQYALEEGAYDAASDLLNAGAKADVRDGEGTAAINVAARQGNTELVRMLIEHGAQVDDRDAHGRPPLCYAISTNNIDLVACLIEAGANVRARASKLQEATALHCACSYGHAAIAALLLEGGADVQATDSDGLTPLHACFESPINTNCGAVVRVLLHYGADEKAEDNWGETPTDYLLSHYDDEEYRARVSAMIARAPCDRAWRRRGWLIMLRERVYNSTNIINAAIAVRYDAEIAVTNLGNGLDSAEGDKNSSQFSGKDRLLMSHSGEEIGILDRDRAETSRHGMEEDAARIRQLRVFGIYAATLEQHGIFRSIVSYL